MPIDTTPSTVATNALQAIPFASLIGGPLEACIKAQALAAKTSYEFINQVGLTIDPITGEKKAINVTFQYNSNGQLTTLVVPLLVMLPIPYLAINTVDIDFLANISASASNVQETTSDTELGVDVTAEASLKVGPFSLKVTAKANYSSKQHSKASSDSKYSVEYTMGVKVSGGQTDMPAGLATILNILQGSITSVSPGDMLQITPANMDFDQVDSATLQANVRTSQGIVVPGTQVSIKVIPGKDETDPFESIIPVVGKTPEEIAENIRSGDRYTIVEKAYNRYYNPLSKNVNLKAFHQKRLIAHSGNVRSALVTAGNAGVVTGVTDKNGNVIFKCTLKKGVFQGYEDMSGKLIISADIPVPGPEGETKMFPETQEIAYNIIPFGPTIELTPSTTKLEFAGTAPGPLTVTITATDSAALVKDLAITTRVILDGGAAASTVFATITAVPAAQTGASAETATSKTNTAGTTTFTYTLSQNNAGTVKTGYINFICDSAIELNIPFTVAVHTTPLPAPAHPDAPAPPFAPAPTPPSAPAEQ